MLYIRFVFTNAGKKAIKRLKDNKRLKDLGYELSFCHDRFEIHGDMNDEELYEMCCVVCDLAVREVICSSVRKALIKDLGDFNSDELEHVCNIVLSKDFVEEIPGRMYVYLKLNGCINPQGFYTFMCRDIDSEVNRCVRCEANKIMELTEQADMIETLKYFSDISPECVSKVVLFADSAGLKIKECIPPRDEALCEYSATETDVLAELVTLNPVCIEIHGKEDFLKNEISTVIEAVFENRIEYR